MKFDIALTERDALVLKLAQTFAEKPFVTKDILNLLPKGTYKSSLVTLGDREVSSVTLCCGAALCRLVGKGLLKRDSKKYYTNVDLKNRIPSENNIVPTCDLKTIIEQEALVVRCFSSELASLVRKTWATKTLLQLIKEEKPDPLCPVVLDIGASIDEAVAAISGNGNPEWLSMFGLPRIDNYLQTCMSTRWPVLSEFLKTAQDVTTSYGASVIIVSSASIDLSRLSSSFGKDNRLTVSMGGINPCAPSLLFGTETLPKGTFIARYAGKMKTIRLLLGV